MTGGEEGKEELPSYDHGPLIICDYEHAPVSGVSSRILLLAPIELGSGYGKLGHQTFYYSVFFLMVSIYPKEDRKLSIV